MNNVKELLELLYSLKIKSLEDKGNQQTVHNCLKEIELPIQNSIKGLINDNNVHNVETSLYDMLIQTLKVAEEKLPVTLNEADATGIVTRIIGATAQAYNDLSKNQNACECSEIPEEVLQIAEALHSQGRPAIIVVNRGNMKDFFGN